MNNTIKAFIILTLTFLFSAGAFFLFKPFKYIDNDKSTILCQSGAVFTIGPNYIYSLDDKLDRFNDDKARKLCQFNTIRDYNNTYQVPKIINYQFNPVSWQNSNWGDAVLVASTVILIGWFALGFFLKDDYKKYLSYRFIFLCLLFSCLIFLVFLKKPVAKLYCQRQSAEKVVNFRNSAFKYGVISIPLEDKHIKDSLAGINDKCLKLNGF